MTKNVYFMKCSCRTIPKIRNENRQKKHFLLPNHQNVSCDAVVFIYWLVGVLIFEAQVNLSARDSIDNINNILSKQVAKSYTFKIIRTGLSFVMLLEWKGATRN